MKFCADKLLTKPVVFRRVSGVAPQHFKQICNKLRPFLQQKLFSGKSNKLGRKFRLDSNNMILCILVYYKVYASLEFIGIYFNLDASNVCRLFKRIEPIFAKHVSIKKKRDIAEQEFADIIIDTTEQPIQRPTKCCKQQVYYSGKKKQHTIKSEIIMTTEGQILGISHAHGGSKHDIKIRKESQHLPIHAVKHVDLGYQGLQKLTNNVILSYKKKLKHKLTTEEKQYNRKLASIRVKIEHKIREMKIFRILSDKYRNFRRKLNMRMNIIAGMINMRHGFC